MSIVRRILPVIIVLQLTLSLLAPAIRVSAETTTPDEKAIFTDVPKDSLYFPHIQRMAERYFLTGYAGNGTLARTFGPDSPITRAEIAKIAAWVRTAEGGGAMWGSFNDEYEAAKSMLETLGIYYKCTASTCAAIGGKDFADVPGKSEECKSSASAACQPWFSQYVNFGVKTGYIKGYPPRVPGEARTFEPYNSILRLHALKMAMVDDFGRPDIKDDLRFKALEAKAVANSSLTPKCLDGAENFIRGDNGGATQDGTNMLRIALLADRLDLFGAHCEALSDLRTYKARADFLMQPVSRKEAARYFALTTSYAPVEPDPATDTTIGTKAENEQGVASLPYVPPAYVPPKPADEKIVAKDPPMPTSPGTATAPKDLLATTAPAVTPAPDMGPIANPPPAATPPGTQPPATPPTVPKPAIPACPAGATKTLLARALPLCAGYDTACHTLAAGSVACLTGNVTARGTGNARKFHETLIVREPGRFATYYVNCDSMMSAACATAGWKAPAATAPVAVLPVAVPTVPVAKAPATFRPDADLVEAVVTGCTSPPAVCQLVADIAQSLNFPTSAIAGCGDNACKAKRVLAYINSLAASTATPATTTPAVPTGPSVDHWYTVIPNWGPSGDKLWGAVFSERKYSEAIAIKTADGKVATLFPTLSGSKYKELVVKVVGGAETYDDSDPNAAANKRAMVKSYRTDRWYWIKYTDSDGKEKAGWVPVSSTVWKDDMFVITDSGGNYLFVNLKSNTCNVTKEVDGKIVIVSTYSCLVGYTNDGNMPVDKLLLHNTAGYGIPNFKTYAYGVHYFLDRGNDNAFHGFTPEYLGSGTMGTKSGPIPEKVEPKTISVEMVNVEWANPIKLKDFNSSGNNPKKKMVSNGLFNSFDFNLLKGNFSPSDIGKTDHYAVIQNYRDGKGVEHKNFDLVKQYFNEKDGFSEAFNHAGISEAGVALKKTIRNDRATFEKFYELKIGEDKWSLKPNYLAILEKQLPSNDEMLQFADLYPVLNKIPFGYNFYNSVKGVLDADDVIDATGTFPQETWTLPNQPSDQILSDGSSMTYYQRYTAKQYSNLEKFVSHMGEKYGIPMKTLAYNKQYDFSMTEIRTADGKIEWKSKFLDSSDKSDGGFTLTYHYPGTRPLTTQNIPAHYGFYFQEVEKKKLGFIENVGMAKGIISHHNQTIKMCPAPGFQIDRIPTLANQSQ